MSVFSRLVGAVLVGVALLLTGPSAAFAAPPQLTFALLASGIAQPTSVVSDGTEALYVTSQPGKIFRYTKTSGVRLWLNLGAKVGSVGSEQGLLGLAFDPKFATTGKAYITYTRPDGALVVARVNTSRTVPSSVTPLFVFAHPGAQNHNGGSLAFTPDGTLLLGTGDGGAGGDLFDNARKLAKPLGKILKINLTTSPPTFSVWLSGVRNPWKISTDGNLLLIADVGQDRFEEVDRISLSSGRKDLGWPCREGFALFDPSRCAGRTMTPPLATFCHDTVPGCAPNMISEALIGGYVYRGKTYSAKLAGLYVAGDFVTGNLWTVTQAGVVRPAGHLTNVSSFGRTSTGELVAVTYEGKLFALKAS